MKAVIQRVSSASVTVNGKVVSEIGSGILTLFGVEKGDTDEKMKRIITKIIELRIFEDEAGKMNRSLADIKGQHLIVSQFTLAGDTSQGRRPSFVGAESPELAKAMYERAIIMSQTLGIDTKGGVFQADMKVALVNDGPVTFVLQA